jgi:hypothetical protein
MVCFSQLLSPYTIALRLRKSRELFNVHLMGPKMPSDHLILFAMILHGLLPVNIAHLRRKSLKSVINEFLLRASAAFKNVL